MERILSENDQGKIALVALVACKPKVLSNIPHPAGERTVLWLTDPTRTMHRALGLGRATWLSFFRPKVLLRYFRSLIHGFLPRKAATGEDLLQLGGDFLWNGEGKQILAHRSDDAGDRPTRKEIVNALQNEGLFPSLNPRHR